MTDMWRAFGRSMGKGVNAAVTLEKAANARYDYAIVSMTKQ